MSHQHHQSNQKQTSSLSPSGPQVKIFMASLPYDITQETLRAILPSHVKIFDIEFKKRNKLGDSNSSNSSDSSERNSKKSNLGFGTLTTNSKGAEYLLQIEQIKVGDRPIRFLEHLSGEKLKHFQQKLGLKKIFVRGLTKGMTPSLLDNIFSRFGLVESCYFRKEPRNTHNIGVVIFKHVNACNAALDYFKYSQETLEYPFLIGRTFSDLNSLSQENNSGKTSRKTQRK